MREIWKDIPNYEGYYQISNLGNVKSLIGWSYSEKCYIKREKILKPNLREYKQIVLIKNKKREYHYIHRLVAQAFVPNPNNLSYVNHKDENKYNNNADNLEFCSHQYNDCYGTKLDRQSIALTKYNILQYDANGNLIKKWFNIREIVRKMGYSKTNIQHCCMKKCKTAYGFICEYLPITDESIETSVL